MISYPDFFVDGQSILSFAITVGEPPDIADQKDTRLNKLG
jgi:hypothetical protein